MRKSEGTRNSPGGSRATPDDTVLQQLAGIPRLTPGPVPGTAMPDPETGLAGQRWLEYLPTGELKVQALIQRQLEPRQVKNLSENWRDSSCEPLVVDRMRPGRPDPGDWIVQGQHRREGSLLRMGRYHLLPCWVGWIDSLEEQARTYLDLNEVVPQRHQKMFQVRIADGEAVACAIKEIVTELGLDLFFEVDQRRLARQWYEIQATQALERIFSYEGSEPLSETLQFDKDCWEERMQAFQAPTILGTADFLRRYARRCKTWDRRRAIHKLQLLDVSEVKKIGRREKLDAAAWSQYNELSLGMFTVFNRGLPKEKRLYDPDKGG